MGTMESLPGESTAGHNGMVAVVGRANVGKSTLVNRLLGEKVSIVSPIAQTTRNMIRGVLTEPRGQLVFLDTPGVHKPRNDLGHIMNKAAYASTSGVDVVLLLVDAGVPPQEEDRRWIQRLASGTTSSFIGLNKADTGTPHADAYRAFWDECPAGENEKPDARWYEISALRGDGTDPLLSDLFEAMPLGPQLFPDDVLTDFPRRWAIADVVREKTIRGLRDELPHAVGVRVKEIEEGDDAWRVDVNIYVHKPSQKGIVIGQRGRKLRGTKRAAEAELSEMFGRPVKLTLHVKVEKDWAKNFFLLKQMGYTE